MKALKPPTAERRLQGLRRQVFKPNRLLAQCRRVQEAINSGVAAGLCLDHSRIRQHLDEFLMNQPQLQKIPALSAIKKMRARWTHPERPALD